jgi:hypothetical protein
MLLGFFETFAVAPECWSGGTTPRNPPVPGFGRPDGGLGFPTLPWDRFSGSPVFDRGGKRRHLVAALACRRKGVEPAIHHALRWWNPGSTTLGFAGAVHHETGCAPLQRQHRR